MGVNSGGNLSTSCLFLLFFFLFFFFFFFTDCAEDALYKATPYGLMM
jgi:hypothetical protein